jgi:hypothetical protein
VPTFNYAINGVNYYSLFFQPSVRLKMKPLTCDRGYDDVLLGQGYCTPHRVVIDGYVTMVE